MSRAAEAAEAVKDLLNAAPPETWGGRTVVAVRRYIPVLDLASIGGGLSVQVVARSDRATGLDRAGGQLHDIGVDVGVQQRLASGTDAQSDAANAEIDALADLVEAIADYLKPGTEVLAGGAVIVESGVDPVYAPEHLTSFGVFTSIVRLGLKLV